MEERVKMTRKVLINAERILAASLCLLVSASLCSAKPSSGAAADEKAGRKPIAVTVTNTDIELFTAIFQPWINGEKPIIVQTETDSHKISNAQISTYVIKSMKDLKLSKEEMTSMLSELAKRNTQPSAIPQIGPKDRVVLKSKKQLNAIFKKGFWAEFRRIFPNSGGLMKLSLPVYSKDGKMALIYSSRATDGRAGSGWLKLFEKVDGKWKSIWSLTLWRS